MTAQIEMPIGVAGIRERIPHRNTMLLIDRVVELVPGEHVVALKGVTYGESCYRREPEATEHTYPHALLLESWNQAAAVLATCDNPNTDVTEGLVMMLGSFTGVTFGADVHPGDVLLHRVRLQRKIDETMIFEGATTVGDREVLRVERAVLAQRPAATLRGETQEGTT